MQVTIQNYPEHISGIPLLALNQIEALRIPYISAPL